MKKVARPTTVTSRPSWPEATTSRALAMIGLCARWWPTSSFAPLRATASTRVLPSATEGAMGFSSSVGRPAWMQASAWGTCSWLGVARITPSGRSLASISSSEMNKGTPASFANGTAAGDGSTMADKVQVGLCCVTPMWAWPM